MNVPINRVLSSQNGVVSPTAAIAATMPRQGTPSRKGCVTARPLASCCSANHGSLRRAPFVIIQPSSQNKMTNAHNSNTIRLSSLCCFAAHEQPKMNNPKYRTNNPLVKSTESQRVQMSWSTALLRLIVHSCHLVV